MSEVAAGRRFIDGEERFRKRSDASIAPQTIDGELAGSWSGKVDL